MGQLDNAGLTLLKRFEGCRLESYPDDSGVWTIGYGHVDGVAEGQIITQAQADAFLWDGAAHTLAVLSAVTAGVATAAFQFDAMVSLAFNIGSAGFRHSTVLRQHRAGNFPAAADAFLLWDKDHRDGQLVTAPGLLRRRQLERGFYLSGIVVARKKRSKSGLSR
jgi:lysozyme